MTELYSTDSRLIMLKDRIEKDRAFDRFGRIVILPIPSTKDGKTVNKTELPLMQVLGDLGGESLVVCYGLTTEIADNLTRGGTKIVDLMKDEGYLVENARLTAQAFLGILLTCQKKSLENLKIGVVGYGRIGKELVKLLIPFGAKIVVYTRDFATRVALSRYGVSTLQSDSNSPICDLDILINTAPVSIFTPDSENIDRKICDLASGENFAGFHNVEKFPNLPSKFYAETAGETVFSTVKKMTLEGKNNGI